MKNIIKKLAVSLIISHGFFDVLDINKWNTIINIANYLITTLFISIVYQIIPDLVILTIIFFSMNHFSKDIPTLFNLPYDNYGTAIFIGTMSNMKNRIYWANVLQVLDCNHINFIYLLYLVKVRLFYDFMINDRFPLYQVLTTIVSVTIGMYNTPYYIIFYYLLFIHMPVAIFRIHQEYQNFASEDDIALSFVILTFITLVFYEYFEVDEIENIELKDVDRNIKGFFVGVIGTHLLSHNLPMFFRQFY